MLDVSKNQRTLSAYESIALDYAASTKGTPSGVSEAAMRRFVASLPTGGSVLELASGPGWDADFVELLGARVRRTDGAAAFCEFQTSRGKTIERLDAITDAYTDRDWPGYDGVMALCLLLHIERDVTDVVLRKVAAALRPGGTFLVSLREGSGEFWEGGESGNTYHVTLWEEPAFAATVRAAGLTPYWSARTEYAEGPWLTFLVRKPRAATVLNRR